jgi:hypothetical protein
MGVVHARLSSSLLLVPTSAFTIHRGEAAYGQCRA